MDKTASQIADTVLEKVALSDDLVRVVLKNRIYGNTLRAAAKGGTQGNLRHNFKKLMDSDALRYPRAHARMTPDLLDKGSRQLGRSARPRYNTSGPVAAQSDLNRLEYWNPRRASGEMVEEFQARKQLWGPKLTDRRSNLHKVLKGETDIEGTGLSYETLKDMLDPGNTHIPGWRDR